MIKKIFWMVCAFLTFTIIIYCFINETINDDANKIQKFKLQHVPREIISSKNKGTFFLFDNGDLCSVKIFGDEIKINKEFENISHASFEREYTALVNKNNEFYFSNMNGENVKFRFANIINAKSQKSKIIKISSGEEFTAVLFADGQLIADISFDNENGYEKESFLVYDDIKDVSCSEYQIFMLDVNNVLQVFDSLKGDKYKRELHINNDTLSIHSGPLELYIYEKSGKLYRLDYDELFHDVMSKADTFHDFDVIKDFSVSSNNVMLAYDEDGSLYHWGFGYEYKKGDKSIPEIMNPEIIFKSDNIELFSGTHDGIFIITQDLVLSVIS